MASPSVMTNAAIAAKLHEMAQMLEVLGENSFRANAHAKAARALESLDQPAALLDAPALQAIDGIGPKLAEKIIECVRTGRIVEHEQLRAKVPQGVLDVLALPGLGPKTVHAMWTTLGVDGVPALRRAIDDGSLRTLPRMGDKAVQKIKDALSLAAASAGRVHLGPAWALAQRVVAHLREDPAVARVEPAGSLRRGKETVGDLDVLVALRDGQEQHAARVMARACGMPGVLRVIASGSTKTSLLLDRTGGTGRWGGDAAEQSAEAPPAGAGVQCDVRVVPLRSFGSALQYFTGSKEHNVRLRGLAQAQGLTLNEWGLFEQASWDAYHDAHAPKDEARTKLPKARAGADEAGIYAALGLPCPPPPLREDVGELDAPPPGAKGTPAGRFADLIEVGDIRSELHAHTTASDGELSIEQLAREAHARGFHTIAVTDHSQSSTIANGLKPDRLRKHIDAVRAVHERLHKELGMHVLAGSEVDILADGSLDYKDELLAQLDVVVASPHAALSQDPATATQRLLRAIAHPLVHILGHPTGRLVMRRAGLSPDMDALCAAAAQHGVAMEINSHWMRLDLRDAHVRGALRHGCVLAIDCDVHAREDFDNLRFGVLTGQRGGLPKERCVNTWPAAKLHAWLRRKR